VTTSPLGRFREGTKTLEPRINSPPCFLLFAGGSVASTGRN
jgi:hypothetical protein